MFWFFDLLQTLKELFQILLKDRKNKKIIRESFLKKTGTSTQPI